MNSTQLYSNMKIVFKEKIMPELIKLYGFSIENAYFQYEKNYRNVL